MTMTLAELLAKNFPPLERYVPILPTVSAQQGLFLTSDTREALYGGAVGGGKSAALLMGALQYVDVPGYRALLLRRTFAELSKGDALIPLSHEWLGPTDATWNEARKQWTFPSGATVEFGHVQNDNDRFNYQGASYAYVGFDELTHFPEEVYTYIGFSRQRRRLMGKASQVPVRTRASANPGGVGHAWVKARFVEEKTRKRDVLFVPAKVRDNPGLDVEDYASSLAHLPDGLRLQLLEGNWDVFEEAAFVVTDAHLVDVFDVRDEYGRFEAADYGLNGAPWALVAVDFEGSLVFADLLYEKNLLPSELAELVVGKRKSGWGFGRSAYMDPSVWHRTGARDKWGRPAMLADEFTSAGVPVTPANNDPRAGLIRLRELLTCDPALVFPDWHPRRGERGSPRIFFHRGNCARLVTELQAAPLQPLDRRDGGEIVDPEWESRHGHACAMARYAVMAKPSASARPDEPPSDDPRVEASYMRAQRLRKHIERVEDPRRRLAHEWV